MSNQQRGTRVSSLAKSIDSVLDTPPAPRPARPTATLRPSWIGPPRPERPRTPGIQTMKQTVVVQYCSPGLQPPVYIFTNLSDPEWEAGEMEPKGDDRGGFIFSRTFQVDDGEYQYKFRLGEGDWWTCDESKPTVDDGQGNKNNLLVVKSESPLGLQSPSPSPKSGGLQGSPKTPEVTSLPKPQLPLSSAPSSVSEKLSMATVPLLKHEAFDSHQGSSAEQTPEREERNPFEVDDEEPNEPLSHNIAESERDVSASLRPEIVKPSSPEQDHAPLFRHESISIGNNHQEPAAQGTAPTNVPLKMNGNPVPLEADPRDRSLERFPSDHAGIIEKIQHAHSRLPEDETSDRSDVGSPSSQAVSESSLTMPFLPAVCESAEEEALEKIREAEEEQVDKEEATGDEVDPLKPTAREKIPEAVEADFEPKVAVVMEKVKVEETINVEVIEEQKGWFEVLLDRFGGQGNALAMAMGLLTIAAGICAMQFL